MKWVANLIKKVMYVESGSSRYRRMWRTTVLAVSAVSIVPLVSITSVNYFMYRRSFQKEVTLPIQSIASVTKRSLESFIEERIAAARYVASRERAPP